MTNKKRGVLYVGVTSDLPKRIWEHKNKLADGFTKRYNLTKLVYFEQTADIVAAITREKQLKRWHRNWKINLIESVNSEWKDLSGELLDAETRLLPR